MNVLLEERPRLDDAISQRLHLIQEMLRKLRPAGPPVDVVFPSWGKLGWGVLRGHWHLIVADDDLYEDLLSMPRECRAEACLVLATLIERMGL